MISLGVIVLFILIPLVGPLIYQHIGAPHQGNFGAIGPDQYHNPFHLESDRGDELFSAQYWLGTDSVGHDQLALLMQGMLISLSVALLVEIVEYWAGGDGGGVSRFLRRLDRPGAGALHRCMFAFPGLLFAILLTGIFGEQAIRR